MPHQFYFFSSSIFFSTLTLCSRIKCNSLQRQTLSAYRSRRSLSLLIASCHFTTFFHLFSTLLCAFVVVVVCFTYSLLLCLVLYSRILDRQEERMRLSTSLTFDWLVMYDTNIQHHGDIRRGTHTQTERERQREKKILNEDEHWTVTKWSRRNTVSLSLCTRCTCG